MNDSKKQPGRLAFSGASMRCRHTVRSIGARRYPLISRATAAQGAFEQKTRQGCTLNGEVGNATQIGCNSRTRLNTHWDNDEHTFTGCLAARAKPWTGKAL